MRTSYVSVRVLGVLLLAAGLLSACYPQVASDAPYVAIVHQPEDITFVEGLVFGTGITDTLQQQELKLDLFLPPDVDRPTEPTEPIDPPPTAPAGQTTTQTTNQPNEPVPTLARPTLVLVHGGGFLFGDRSDFHAEARAWAQRGYVVATPTYRLASEAPPDRFRDIGPALDASGDGQLAIKWLRANAETYGIDTNRIAVIGASAGGVVALATGQTVDLTNSRFEGSESHVANAVIATGAPFSPFIALQVVTSATIGAPALIHHYEQDWVTGFSGEEARITCLVWATAPSPHRCLPVIVEGSGHTLGIGPEAFLAESSYHPFLAFHLDLAGAPDPRPQG